MEIKTDLTPKMCLLLAGTMVFVSSCQDYEPFSDETLHDKAYTQEFVKQFGEIDPDQDWDLFGQLARHIGPVTRANSEQLPQVNLLNGTDKSHRACQQQTHLWGEISFNFHK